VELAAVSAVVVYNGLIVVVVVVEVNEMVGSGQVI
jgi:hypothetical protein